MAHLNPHLQLLPTRHIPLLHTTPNPIKHPIHRICTPTPTRNIPPTNPLLHKEPMHSPPSANIPLQTPQLNPQA
ncbi:hypothetical protein L873DRAFT_1800288 [Choiromyces venosus 120613-1]|uniref:Uncharacterized protein n=1 Tax=Choiromyces venosus 120613-1 TaxID=1336337 RepID=A0A3N4K5R5_9PEZI|nr:hypothetical protein L873DRAFT_1800288 [Choiromyces venosus 120613-1]